LIETYSQKYVTSTAGGKLDTIFYYSGVHLANGAFWRVREDIRLLLGQLPPSIVRFPPHEYEFILKSTAKSNSKHIIKIGKHNFIAVRKCKDDYNNYINK
jgi:hypothetical protein